MTKKLAALLSRLKGCGSLVVALSGGVDSATLAKAASVALGERGVAITARSELLSADELACAKVSAKEAGIRHVIIDAHDLDNPAIVSNDKNRCYYCKRGRFEKLCAWARENGFDFVADGGNLDDKGDYRPGMRAIEELAPMVISPFIDCQPGWTKADVRRQAREWELAVAERPSAACLASRVEYGLPLTPERLAQVETAERVVSQFAIGQLRVRHHGNIARIEVEADSFENVTSHRSEIAAALKKIGFSYIALDIEGYRTGSTNETL